MNSIATRIRQFAFIEVGASIGRHPPPSPPSPYATLQIEWPDPVPPALGEACSETNIKDVLFYR